MNFVIAIPARYGASRLPGKPLRLLGGEPLVLHVARRALAAGAAEVVVATDDARVAGALAGQPVTVCMTRGDHASGTDRLAECADRLGWPDELIVLNLQGDEPFAPAAGLRVLAQALEAAPAPMATLATPIDQCADLFDPSTVKVICDAGGRALFFSRAPMPWARERFARDRASALPAGWLRHIGVYAYRAGFLRRFRELPPGRLEALEALEQLRVLEAGIPIHVVLSPEPFPPGVDTEEDLRRAQTHLNLGLEST